jgi:hypothetical protein
LLNPLYQNSVHCKLSNKNLTSVFRLVEFMKRKCTSLQHSQKKKTSVVLDSIFECGDFVENIVNYLVDSTLDTKNISDFLYKGINKTFYVAFTNKVTGLKIMKVPKTNIICDKANIICNLNTLPFIINNLNRVAKTIVIQYKTKPSIIKNDVPALTSQHLHTLTDLKLKIRIEVNIFEIELFRKSLFYTQLNKLGYTLHYAIEGTLIILTAVDSLLYDKV